MRPPVHCRNLPEERRGTLRNKVPQWSAEAELR
jgi:hypothetical protein